MKVKGSCVSQECIHCDGDNNCNYGNAIIIYKGQCLKYEEREEENNK